MSNLRSKGSFFKLYSWLPLIVLYTSVLNEFDFNYLNLDYFSFNFPFILIFFFTLKDFKNFDYFLVFIAGLFNDTVVGLPLGISSLSYTLLCIATSYFRSITLRPNIIKDWIFFLITISCVNSIYYIVISYFFNVNIDYRFLLTNNFATFLSFFLFYFIFDIYHKQFFG